MQFNRTIISYPIICLMAYQIVHAGLHMYNIAREYYDYINPRIFGYRYTDYFFVITVFLVLTILFQTLIEEDSFKVKKIINTSICFLSIILATYIHKGSVLIEKDLAEYKQFLIEDMTHEIIGIREYYRHNPTVIEIFHEIEKINEIEKNNYITKDRN